MAIPNLTYLKKSPKITFSPFSSFQEDPLNLIPWNFHFAYICTSSGHYFFPPTFHSLLSQLLYTKSKQWATTHQFTTPSSSAYIGCQWTSLIAPIKNLYCKSLRLCCFDSFLTLNYLLIVYCASGLFVAPSSEALPWLWQMCSTVWSSLCLARDMHRPG